MRETLVTICAFVGIGFAALGGVALLVLLWLMGLIAQGRWMAFALGILIGYWIWGTP